MIKNSVLLDRCALIICIITSEKGDISFNKMHDWSVKQPITIWLDRLIVETAFGERGNWGWVSKLRLDLFLLFANWIHPEKGNTLYCPPQDCLLVDNPGVGNGWGVSLPFAVFAGVTTLLDATSHLWLGRFFNKSTLKTSLTSLNWL